ncbi:MAG: hypothetical protein V1494_03165 [Candidatus Diapherotrites archaeon]
MIFMGYLTTIQVQSKTRQKLEKLKAYPRETYDDVVNKLIRVKEIVEKEPELKEEVIEEMNLAEKQLKEGKGINTEELAKRLGVTL